MFLAVFAALTLSTPPALASVRPPPAPNLSMLSQYNSTAFGENYVPGTNEGVPQRYTFQGREASAVGGPMSFRNRSYSPSLGRFGRRDLRLGGDPLYNAYAGMGNNAVQHVDPTGEQPPLGPLCVCAGSWVRPPPASACNKNTDGYEFLRKGGPGFCMAPSGTGTRDKCCACITALMKKAGLSCHQYAWFRCNYTPHSIISGWTAFSRFHDCP